MQEQPNQINSGQIPSNQTSDQKYQILPQYMTAQEAIIYLRLDQKPGKTMDRLRNLMRRHGLPKCQRGHVILFRREDLDKWLQGSRHRR